MTRQESLSSIVRHAEYRADIIHASIARSTDPVAAMREAMTEIEQRWCRFGDRTDLALLRVLERCVAP